LQAGLINIPATQVSTLSGLETGTHNFCFGVDWVMNGALDSEALVVDCISVTVTGQSGDTGERFQPGEFQYQGAFRLPDECNWGPGPVVLSRGKRGKRGALAGAALCHLAA